MALSPETEQRILTLFNLDRLKEGQRELLGHVLEGRHALGVLPTGYGKSLCYQAAAVLLGGTSVVVSPLLALMREQVQGLQRRGIRASRFDSTLGDGEKETLLRELAAGQVMLLFVAPESLENEALQQALDATPLSLFVVDEAHCVSEWGHSFRPDYLKLPSWQQKRHFRSILALTATAPLRVQKDLCHTFNMSCVTAISPYRPNITRLVRGSVDRENELLHFLHEPEHTPAIIYTRTRKETERLAALLSQAGLPASCYHAGQPPGLREQLQDDFLANKIRCLVATIAFGMGIDKPDVRAVIHFNIPASPESYLQESGRAGRDGLPATSLVLLDGGDVVDAENRLFAAEPDAEGILRCMRWLLPAAPRAVSLWELGSVCDIAEDVAWRAIALLQERGSLDIQAHGCQYYKARPLFPLPTIIEGRDEEEAARLQWLNTHREGQVEEAADAWGCAFPDAMEQLRECEASGEWKLTFRQHALYLCPGEPADARSLAAELSAAYRRRREADRGRLHRLLQMLAGDCCINAALELYFTGKEGIPCGHCSVCLKQAATLPPPPPAPSLPEARELPPFDRETQRRRFLLGLASPALLARRLWQHSLYGSAAGARWQDL